MIRVLDSSGDTIYLNEEHVMYIISANANYCILLTNSTKLIVPKDRNSSLTLYLTSLQ